MCLGQLKLPEENTIDWVAYEQPKFNSHGLELEVQDHGADCLVRACLLVHTISLVLLLCLYVVGGARELSGASFVRALIE